MEGYLNIENGQELADFELALEKKGYHNLWAPDTCDGKLKRI